MPAIAIFKINPLIEPAHVSQPVECLAPRIVFGRNFASSVEIEGATNEELEIICAMINGVAARVESEREAAE